LEDFSMPLEGLHLYYALLGLVQTTSSTGGFDFSEIIKIFQRTNFHQNIHEDIFFIAECMDLLL